MAENDGFNATIRCRCEKSLKERLKRIAGDDDRKLSDLVRAVLLRYAYAEEHSELAGKPSGTILQLLKDMATPTKIPARPSKLPYKISRASGRKSGPQTPNESKLQ